MTTASDLTIAVMKNEFYVAERLYEVLHMKTRTIASDVDGVSIETKADLGDRVLSWMGVEGFKGAWRVASPTRTIVIGFDEWITKRPDITGDELSLLVEIGIMSLDRKSSI